jgi:hypothetical protein
MIFFERGFVYLDVAFEPLQDEVIFIGTLQIR